MSNTFLIADPHLSHEGVCHFLRADGSKLRPWDSSAEMDEAMVANWNGVVGPHDKVYVLGDVVMRPRHLPILSRLNGRKVLIKGNHDIFKMKLYAQYFYDIRAYHMLDKCWLSHIPIHPESVGRVRVNVHGHIHDRAVMRYEKHVEYSVAGPGRVEPIVREQYEEDPRYYCVSAERINYTPIEWNHLRSLAMGRNS